MRTQAQSLGFVSSMTEGVSPPRHAGAPHLTPVSGGLRFHLAGCPDVLARPLPLPTQAPRPAHWPLQGLALALSLIAGGSRPAAGSRRATSSPTGAARAWLLTCLLPRPGRAAGTALSSAPSARSTMLAPRNCIVNQ